MRLSISIGVILIVLTCCFAQEHKQTVNSQSRSDITREMQQWEPNQRIRLERAFAKGADKNLPMADIENKVREGMTKKVPVDQLVQTVEQRVMEMERYSNMIDTEMKTHGKTVSEMNSKQEMVMSMMNASDMGMSYESCQTIMQTVMNNQSMNSMNNQSMGTMDNQSMTPMNTEVTVEAMRMGEVCRGVGMSEDQAVEVTTHFVEQQYSSTEMEKASNWMMQKHADMGEEFPSDQVYTALCQTPGQEQYMNHQMGQQHMGYQNNHMGTTQQQMQNMRFMPSQVMPQLHGQGSMQSGSSPMQSSSSSMQSGSMPHK